MIYSNKIKKLNPDNLPMNDTHYFKWMKAGNYLDNRMDCKLAYLVSFGFVKGLDKISKDIIDVLNCIHEVYYYSWESIAFKTDSDFFDLLELGEGENSTNLSFYNSGGGYTYYRVIPRVKLKQWIKENMLSIYQDVIYYELIERSDGRHLLFAKYNRILGNRRIAYIDSDTIPQYNEEG